LKLLKIFWWKPGLELEVPDSVLIQLITFPAIYLKGTLSRSAHARAVKLVSPRFSSLERRRQYGDHSFMQNFKLSARKQWFSLPKKAKKSSQNTYTASAMKRNLWSADEVKNISCLFERHFKIMKSGIFHFEIFSFFSKIFTFLGYAD